MDDPEPLFSLILLSGFINPFHINTLISVIVLFVLLLFSALISGSEVAFFSLNPTEKEELNNDNTKSSGLIKELLNSPKKLLATILISNNFVNVAIIILSTYVLENALNFAAFPHIELFGTDISAVVIFSIKVVGITFLILLLGEVIPKIYATKHGLSLARLMVKPLKILKKIFRPISSLLISSTKLIDRRIKRKGLDVSIEELSRALDLTEDIPENKDEHRILKGIVRFGETSVKQIMRSRVDVIALEEETSYEEVIETVLACGHSRIPVYKESFDKVIGVLYVKDLLAHIGKKNNFNWKELIRNPFFIPENKKLDDLLGDFQNKKVHLAIVVDEYGGTSGIITLEDVLEEIVGDISDEFDEEDVTYSKLDNNTYVFDAKTAINDVYKVLDQVDEDYFKEVQKDADTLAGLVIELAGKIPMKNERTQYKKFTFIVEASDKRRVKRVKLSINDSYEEDE